MTQAKVEGERKRVLGRRVANGGGQRMGKGDGHQGRPQHQKLGEKKQEKT